MSLTKFLLELAAVYVSLSSCMAHDDNTVYMEDYCDKKIKIRTVQNIALSEDVFYPSGWRCQTTVEAPPGHVIWFNFHYFDVGRPSVIYCTDVLRIYDGKTTNDFDFEFAVIYNKRRDTTDTEISPNKGLCGRLLPRPIATSGNIATFKFKSMVVSTSTGFKLTATVQRKPDSKICSENEFQCLDDICIDKKLKCDQEVNCQDNSDESAQYAGCEGILAKWTDLSTFARVGIIVGTVVGMGLILCLCVTACIYFSPQKRYKRLKD